MYKYVYMQDTTPVIYVYSRVGLHSRRLATNDKTPYTYVTGGYIHMYAYAAYPYAKKKEMYMYVRYMYIYLYTCVTKDSTCMNIYIHIYMYIYICMIRLLSYINMMQLEPRSLFNLFFQTHMSLSQPSQFHDPSHPLHVILRMDSRAACMNTRLFWVFLHTCRPTLWFKVHLPSHPIRIILCKASPNFQDIYVCMECLRLVGSLKLWVSFAE